MALICRGLKHQCKDFIISFASSPHESISRLDVIISGLRRYFSCGKVQIPFLLSSLFFHMHPLQYYTIVCIDTRGKDSLIEFFEQSILKTKEDQIVQNKNSLGSRRLLLN
ncbi:hypothetical protein WN944_023603 [Citrus x changshan-huyou]|uniref:Uncharacterized protein n=1 Tax=Citrus x changshan-huyou TaxID=2935761 RepID=A0AAP0N4H2_9ROSI